MKRLNRRKFLQYGTSSLIAASPLMTLLGSLQKLEAAQTTGEYKALVCILLEGGADVFNMVVPTQPEAYASYQKVRKQLAVPQEALLPIKHANKNEANNLSYGFRSNMQAMQNLFENKNLAILANVGTLVSPLSLADIKNGATLPPQLFAHNTQRDLWMRGDGRGYQKSGWVGRASDLFYPTPNPYFNVTVADSNILQEGGQAEAISFSEPSVSPDTMTYYGFGPESGGSDLGKVYQRLYEQKAKDSNKLMAAGAQKRLFKLNQQEILQNLFDGVKTFEGFSDGVHETGKPLGKQLELVAQILSVRDNFPNKPKRQIFFVNHHGWDTHDSDNAHQAEYLSESLEAFYNALKEMGIENQVTTFTISDFGRSLSPNGAGTDHGWGAHAFVMGGAVKGGDIYGKMPILAPDSPDAWEDRMIPTTAIEQYYAVLMRWFGATEAETAALFPNLKAFGTPLPDFL